MLDTSSSGEGQVVLLDSGYTMSSLPHEMFTKLLAAFPEAEKRQDHYYKVDCLPEGEGGSVSFTFGSVTIDVPYYDFVFHVPNADNYCVLGVYEHGKTRHIPGRPCNSPITNIGS